MQSVVGTNIYKVRRTIANRRREIIGLMYLLMWAGCNALEEPRYQRLFHQSLPIKHVHEMSFNDVFICKDREALGFGPTFKSLSQMRSAHDNYECGHPCMFDMRDARILELLRTLWSGKRRMTDCVAVEVDGCNRPTSNILCFVRPLLPKQVIVLDHHDSS